MLKAALWLFAAIIALLTVLALQPGEQQELPPAEVLLNDVSVVLYPRADEEAVWRFASPQVDYSPDSSTSVLRSLSDGRRTVDGETDFTLAADELLIDANENLRGDRVIVNLLQSGECLTMLADSSGPVVIEQSSGLFRVPQLHIAGPAWGSDNQWLRVEASFDLEDFSAGGPGTLTVNEFLAGDGQGDPRRTACEN